jgi:hypothetical protein
MIFHSFVEERASEATKLSSFPINLVDLKRAITEILSQFGKNLMFSEYTPHDVTHIDDMLTTIEWIIPPETKKILSPAEWLTITLVTYFHDMGLVVTEDEFNARDKSGFKQFCQQQLFSSPNGSDYHAKVSLLESEKRERFLYQEFVRFNHARRVRA